jgi:hypothetical protein
MRSSRLLNTILLSSIAGATSYGLFSQTRSQQRDRVPMKHTKHHDLQASPLLSYDYLISKISEPRDHTAIFACTLHRQHKTLTQEQVKELAALALKHNHVLSLDLLVEYFPEIITPNWLNQALINNPNRFLYSSLLHEHAAGKIKNLDYLFNPANELVLIEESDQASIAKARLFTHSRKIALIDSEYYDPSYKFLT